MVEIPQVDNTPVVPETNAKKYACGKCRTLLFSEDDFAEHTSNVKDFSSRDNKVRKKHQA